MIQRPDTTEYAEYYADYVRRVPGGDVLDILEKQLSEFRQTFSTFSDEQAMTAPKENAWTLKQVLGHLCDAERVFGYRAFRISRRDTTPLATFDQDAFVREGKFNERALSELLEELEHLRRANLVLFRSISEEASTFRGTASGYPVSVRALMYIAAGHAQRHLELISTGRGRSAIGHPDDKHSHLSPNPT